jgi:hypothetical protein
MEGGADLDDSDNGGNAPGGLYIDWRSPRVKADIEGRRRRFGFGPT